jgi:hypothetical protein
MWICQLIAGLPSKTCRIFRAFSEFLLVLATYSRPHAQARIHLLSNARVLSKAWLLEFKVLRFLQPERAWRRVRCITSPTARFFGGLGIEGAGGSKQQRVGRVRRRKLST